MLRIDLAYKLQAGLIAPLVSSSLATNKRNVTMDHLPVDFFHRAVTGHARRLRSMSPSALSKRYLRINRYVVDCGAPFNLDILPYSVVAMAIETSHLPIRTAGDTVSECLEGTKHKSIMTV